MPVDFSRNEGNKTNRAVWDLKEELQAVSLRVLTTSPTNTRNIICVRLSNPSLETSTMLPEKRGRRAKEPSDIETQRTMFHSSGFIFSHPAKGEQR